MQVRWFGDSWGAPICDPDYKIDRPVGTKCLECARPITGRDRGVVTACSSNIWGSWNFPVEGGSYRVASYHLTCFLDQVIGGEWSTKMLSRMNGPQRETLGTDGVLDNVPDDPEQVEDVEEPQPGRGWGRPVEDGP